MGSPVTASASRSITVSRGTTALTTGSSYQYGETLTVKLSSTSGEYMFQTDGGAFTGSGIGCSGTRVSNAAGSLVMPCSGSLSVNIKAPGQQVKVLCTPDLFGHGWR